MKIPDHISPIVGYRGWWWPYGSGMGMYPGLPSDPAMIYSFNREAWMPGEALRAEAKCTSGIGAIARTYLRSPDYPQTHKAPALDCTCGIYATRDKQHFAETGYESSATIFGEVNLWGTVVEHTLGWRAEYAYPKFLSLRASVVTAVLGSIGEVLAPLALFGVPLHVRLGLTDVPLWDPQHGFDNACLQFLAHHAAKTYRPRVVPPLQVGDRVYYHTAMLVVTDVGDAHVEVVDGRKSRARLAPNQFHWSHDSNHWLADGSLRWIGQEWLGPTTASDARKLKLR